MSSFAIFRMPHATSCTLVAQNDGEPLRLASAEQLGPQQGFVLAPFLPDDLHPVLLIRPDRVVTAEVTDAVAMARSLVQEPTACVADDRDDSEDSAAESPEAYTDNFDAFHQALLEGRFQKLVLARRATLTAAGTSSPLLLFAYACKRYPRLFVALVSTQQSGTWLTATPEILLQRQGELWRTIALAGTMRLTGEALGGEGEQVEWSVKNIREQRIVASYIAETLSRLGLTFHEDGPRTVRAANLVHLRSDFTFPLNDNVRAGSLLAALHPTPAVCGLPKADALRFIVAHEHCPRSYYCGFMGPFNLDLGDDDNDVLATSLYVSLRCMNITPKGYRLYAGGGLLPESSCQKEWQETEAKMETMLHLLQQ